MKDRASPFLVSGGYGPCPSEKFMLKCWRKGGRSLLQKVGQVGENMNKSSVVYKVSTYNTALSTPVRMKIMKLLGSNVENSLTVSQIAEILNLSQPTVTKHLQILFHASLVKFKKVKTSKYYSINVESVEEYYRLIKSISLATYTPCKFNYQCDDCPYTETCI